MFKKLLSMLMVGILSTTLLVGCNSTQEEADNAKTKIEEAKEENMKQTKKEDNKLEDKLQTKKEQTKKEQTKKEDTKQTTKQGTKQDSSKQTTKEKTSTSKKDRCWLCNRIITNENFGGYSNDGTMICSSCLNKYLDDKEEPESRGYYITCPNGHRVYTENGDYDCQRCYEDYLNEQYEESIQEPDNADIDTYSNDYEQEYEEQEYEEQEYDENNE